MRRREGARAVEVSLFSSPLIGIAGQETRMGRLRRNGRREEKTKSSTSHEDDMPHVDSHPRFHRTARPILRATD